MGTYNKGILGAFSGKVGPVVGANWKGMDMRSFPKKTRRAPTENQLLQRLKFTAATRFLTPINSVVGRYFGNESGEKTKKKRGHVVSHEGSY